MNYSFSTKPSRSIILLLVAVWLTQTAWFRFQSQPEETKPSVQIEIDRDTITVGDLFTLTLEVTYSPELIVQLPGTDTNMDPFDIREHRLDGPVEMSSKILKSTVTFVLTGFNTGELEVPPLLISYSDSEGTVGEIQTEPIAIRIESVLDETSEDIQDLKPPLSIPRDWTPTIVGVGVVVLAVGVLFFLYRKYLRKLHPGAKVLSAGPRRPAHEIALERLKRLRESDLIQNGQVTRFHTSVSEIVRKYIENRYDIDALEMTSCEILEQISQEIEYKETTIKLESFLNQCDLVKFAKYQATFPESSKVLDQAFDFVEGTREKPTPKLESRPNGGVD